MYAILVLAFLIPSARSDISDAVELYGRGQYQKAVDVLAAKSDSPSNPGIRSLWLGKAYLKLQRWDEAIREFELAVRAEPGNCLLHLWLGRAYGRKASHVVFFRAISLAGNVRDEFERARSLCPDKLEVRFDLLDFYLQAPGVVGGGKEKAGAEAQEIARISPRMGYTARARIAEWEKDWDLARRELAAGVNLFPKDPSTYCDLAQYLVHRESPVEAAEIARQALRLIGDLPKAQFLLAVSEILAGRDLLEAVAALEALSRRILMDEDPSFQDVYSWLGRGLLALGRKAEALKVLEAALRFDPDHKDAKAALQKERSES
jgi:tetratricopeptide (TPR) repeat protein